MLHASGFVKIWKVYEIFPIFYFIHLVTSDDLEPSQVNFDPSTLRTSDHAFKSLIWCF